MVAFLGASCTPGAGTSSPQVLVVGRAAAVLPATERDPGDLGPQRVLLDFEQPNPDFAVSDLVPAVAPAPASQRAQPGDETGPARFSRSSNQPHGGLWCLRLPVARALALRHPLGPPTDLRLYHTLWVYAMEDSGIAASGVLQVRSFLEDAAGHQIKSDSYPLLGRWAGIPFDLKAAREEGLLLDQIVAVGLEITPVDPTAAGLPQAINVQTDDWVCAAGQRIYTGQRLGVPGTFFVQRSGARLQVGNVGKFELIFHDRAGVDRPWLEMLQGENGQRVLGQLGTGLMLLNQDQFDAIAPGLHQGAMTGGQVSPALGRAPGFSWPGAQSQWLAQCAWSSPAGAIIEVTQTVGPFDRLGRAAAILNWRFMVYPTGHIFVHVAWRHETDHPTAVPVTWALVLDRATLAPHADQPERLLKDIYPEPLRGSVLPHQMQVGAPLHMLAKVGGGEANLYWWADAGGNRLFGVGLPLKSRNGPLDCLLLAQDAQTLEVAGCFSQYLAGPALAMKIGVQDFAFPGDFDNDGIVEPYGFQAIRLASGQAVFDLDPQSRPIYYPAFLITNPIGAPSLEGYRLLVNIDGQQMADPPKWPDGSYLLQLPWVISKPVHVEVRAVRE